MLCRTTKSMSQRCWPCVTRFSPRLTPRRCWPTSAWRLTPVQRPTPTRGRQLGGSYWQNAWNDVWCSERRPESMSCHNTHHGLGQSKVWIFLGTSNVWRNVSNNFKYSELNLLWFQICFTKLQYLCSEHCYLINAWFNELCKNCLLVHMN